MNQYKVEQCPLIFPRLCCALLDAGLSFRVVGKMGGDYQLNRYLTKYLLSTPQIESIPDIVYYDKDKRQWTEIFDEICTLDCGKQGSYEYIRSMTKLISKPNSLEVLFDYLRLNSAANIERLNITVGESAWKVAPAY